MLAWNPNLKCYQEAAGGCPVPWWFWVGAGLGVVLLLTGKGSAKPRPRRVLAKRRTGA